jgi:DNA-binding GntR family transcriptional regulator
MLATKRFGKIYPPGEYARIVSADQVPAPANVADALNLKQGALVIRRRRVTYDGDRAVSSSTSWFDASLAASAPDLLKLDRITQGTAGYIEQQTGRKLRLGRDDLAAAAADPSVAADLDVPIGAPVLVGRNWVRDDSGDVVEFGEFASLAGRVHAYEYELA